MDYNSNEYLSGALWAIVVVLVVFSWLTLFFSSVDSIDLYSSSDIQFRENSTSVIEFYVTVQPYMMNGQKVHFTGINSMEIEIYHWYRPYERAYVKYSIFKDGKKLDSDTLRGFTLMNQTYRIFYPASGPYLVNFTGNYVSISFYTNKSSIFS